MPTTTTTTIDDLHSDIVNRALRLMDGPTLAAAASSSSRLRSLASDPAIWRHLCLSTWPSLNNPRLLSLLSDHHRSFFSQSFPFPLIVDDDDDDEKEYNQNDANDHPTLLPTRVISAIDLYHEGIPVFCRVLDTDTSSTWFLNSPFQLDGLDRKDPELYPSTEPAINPDRLTLSWVVIDPCTQRAVNVSSRKPVSVDRHWFTGEVLVRFVLVLRGCAVMVLVTCAEESGHVRQVRLTVEDMDGKWVSGKGSLGILTRAMEGRRRVEVKARERYEEYSRRKRERLERKSRRDGLMDLCCTGVGALVFLAFLMMLAFR